MDNAAHIAFINFIKETSYINRRPVSINVTRINILEHCTHRDLFISSFVL